jgi:hypothetical protein
LASPARSASRRPSVSRPACSVLASSKRVARQERNEDYTFIVDRSIETLERDLPLVIERVRVAGLAPVFLIDELDKLEIGNALEEPGPASSESVALEKPNGTRKTVTELIRRLKHLTTDFGFFCFLTGPEYFEDVQHKVETLAFPEEHTYFSDRLFVLYTLGELNEFLRSVIVSDALSGSPDAITDETARAVLARVIVHRSRLNTIDLVRALGHGWTEDGRYGVPSGTLGTQPRYRLEAAVQLAIEHVLRGGRLAQRCARDPRLRQLAVDTLYMISRAWERGATEIDLSEAALAKDLLRRRGREVHDLPDDAAAAELDKTVVEASSEELAAALARLAELLCDFGVLSAALAFEGRFDEMALATAQAALLVRLDPNSQFYLFCYDYDGNEIRAPLVSQPPQAAAAPDVAPTASTEFAPQPSAPPEPEIAPLIEFAREVIDTMHFLGLTFSDLSAVGLLPPGLSQSEVLRVVERLDAGGGALQPELRGISADLVVLRSLSEAFSRHGPVLGLAIDLATDVAASIGPGAPPLAAVLRALARFLDFAAREAAHPGLENIVMGADSRSAAAPALGGDARWVRAWREWLRTREVTVVPEDLDELVNRAWARWERTLGQ